jgi:hypothetical protein
LDQAPSNSFPSVIFADLHKHLQGSRWECFPSTQR